MVIGVVYLHSPTLFLFFSSSSCSARIQITSDVGIEKNQRRAKWRREQEKAKAKKPKSGGGEGKDEEEEEEKKEEEEEEFDPEEAKVFFSSSSLHTFFYYYYYYFSLCSTLFDLCIPSRKSTPGGLFHLVSFASFNACGKRTACAASLLAIRVSSQERSLVVRFRSH